MSAAPTPPTASTPPTRPPAIAPGNVAVITGGASGIGLATAEAMVADGMSVVLADIDEPKLRDVEARLSEDGASVASVVCDTTSEAEVNALVESTVERFGGLHVMFNNAGVAGIGDAWAGPVALWRRVLDVNVLGVVYGIRAALPVMQEQGVGHVVSTASHAGLNGAPGIAPYVASKHAVVGLMESLFLELELTASPVGASVLCPEFVRTDLMSAAKEPEVVGAPVAQAINQMLHAGVEGGIPAGEVGTAVVEGVRAGRFWILTHESTKDASVARVQRAADGVNPTIALGQA